jgi:hypothetical protein
VFTKGVAKTCTEENKDNGDKSSSFPPLPPVKNMTTYFLNITVGDAGIPALVFLATYARVGRWQGAVKAGFMIPHPRLGILVNRGIPEIRGKQRAFRVFRVFSGSLSSPDWHET